MSCGRRSRDIDDDDVIILGSESSSSSDGFPNISVRTPTAGSVGHSRSKVDSKTSSFPRSCPDDRVHAHTPEVKTLYRKPLSTTSSGKRTQGNSKLWPLKSPSTPDPLVSTLFPAQGASKTTPCATPNPGKSSQGFGCNAVPSSSKARMSTGESRAKKVIPFMDARKEAKRKKSVCSGKPSLVSPGGVESVKHHNKHSQPRQLSDGGENGVEKGGIVRRRPFLSPDGSSSGGQDQAVKSSGSTGTERRRQFLSPDGSSSAGSGGQDQAVKSSGSTGIVRRRQFLSPDGSSSAGSGGQDQAVKSSGSTGTVRRRQFLSPDGSSSSSADSGGQDQAVKSSGPQRKVRRYSLGSTESQQIRNVSTKAKNLVTSTSGTSHRTANSHSTSEVVKKTKKGLQDFSGQQSTKGKTPASGVCCVPEPPTSLPDDLLSMDTSDPSDTPTSPAPSLTSGGKRKSGVKPAGNNPTPPGHVVCAQLLMAHSMVKEDKRRSPTVVARPKHQHRSSDKGKGRDSRVDRKIKTKAHLSNTPTPSSGRAAKQGVNKPECTTSKAKASTTTAAARKTKANPTPSPTASSSHSSSSTPLPTARSKPSSHSRMPAPSTSMASTGEATNALPKDKESETETSSMFEFTENDLFEVLDSVETDSVYSAYNQSDTESMTMNTESYSSRPTSESDHFTSTLPSNLVKSVRCQLPTDSCVGDLPPSVVAKKKRRQVAKKSTTRNGMKYYKHPTKGYLLSLKRHCMVNVKRSWVYVQKRVKKDVSMQQSKMMTKHLTAKPTANPILPSAPNKPPASTASRVELKKKRESASEDSMTTCTSAKRPKLSSDALASKQVKPSPVLVTVLKEPTLLPKQKSCDSGNKVSSTTPFEKNTGVGDTSPALATSSTSHTQREQPSPKQRTQTGSQDAKSGNVPLTLSTSTPSTSHAQSKQPSSKQGTVAGSRNRNNQQRSLTPSTPATSHTHSKQASSQHSTTAGSRNKNAQNSQQQQQQQQQQQHTVTSTLSTPISHSQNSVTQRAAEGSRNKDLQQRFLPVSTPSASHPSSRPSQGSAARSQQHGNVQQKQVSSSRPKEIPKSKEAALPVQKGSQLSKSVQKGSQLPKSVEKGSQLSKSVQKDGQLPKSVEKGSQLPKSVQKDCQLPKSVEKSSQLSKSVQKDCQLPKSVEKGSQLSKSVQKDGQLPKSVEKGSQLSKSVEKDGQLPKSVEKGSQLSKSVEKDCQLPKSVEKGSQLSKSVQKDGQLPKSVEKGSQLSKSVQKDGQLPKSVEKGSQLSKSVEKDGQLPKSVQTEGGCVPKSREAALQKDGQLSKSVQKDGYLPNQKDGRLPKQTTTHVSLPQKKRPLLPKPALLQARPLPILVSKSTSVVHSPSLLASKTAPSFILESPALLAPKSTSTMSSPPLLTSKTSSTVGPPSLPPSKTSSTVGPPSLPPSKTSSTVGPPSLPPSKTSSTLRTTKTVGEFLSDLHGPPSLPPSKNSSTVGPPSLPPSKTSSTVGPPSLPPSKTSSTLRTTKTVGEFLSDLHGPPSLPPSKTSSTVGPPSLPPSKTSSTVGPPSLPPSKTSSTLRTTKTVGEFLSDLHVFLGKNSDISSSQSENKHESGLPSAEREHNKKLQLAGNRTSQAASAVIGAGEKAQPSLLDTACSESNRSAGTPGAGEKQGVDVPQPQILSQTSRGVVHMSPEKTPASLEPVTPVGRKCLSLKRTRLSKTPSFSDSTSEICRSPPLSPVGPGSGSLSLLGGVSASGTADAAQKRGGNIVRIVSHMQMKPHAHVAPRPRGGKVMPVVSDSQSSQTEDSDGEALETEEIQLAMCVGSNSGDARKSTQSDTRKEESSVAQSDADKMEESSVAQSDADRREQSSVALSDADKMEQSSIAQSDADRREQSSVALSDADRREQSSVAQSDADRREQSSMARLSQQDQAYDLRLLETIAKLAPQETAPSMERSAAHTSSAGVERMEGDWGMEGRENKVGVCMAPPLTVSIPLARLCRVPPVSPTVSTRVLGMFMDKAVQAERGMIVDKDVLDAYLMVKLHEAMFDMKEQLQMMEAQVTNIAREKERLERTLQAKTQYIRDMTTTGFKPGMVDKSTYTDSYLSLPSTRLRGRSSVSVATQTRKLPSSSPKAQKAVKMVEGGTQTLQKLPTLFTVASQTDGVVHTVPARLQPPSQPLCLYNHPDSEIQLYIERGRHSTASSSRLDDNREKEDLGEDPTALKPNQQWLSMAVSDSCSRCVAVDPKVRFLRGIHDKAVCVERRGCARCTPTTRSSGSTSETEAVSNIPVVQFATQSQSLSISPNAKDESGSARVPGEKEGTCTCRSKPAGFEKAEACLPSPLRASIAKLIELYFKLKALPKEPVLARHMASLLAAVHHLLSHLPVEIKPPPGTSPGTSSSPASQSLHAPLSSAQSRSEAMPAPSDPPSTHPLTLTATPTTPPSSSPPPSSSSPPSTPGAAAWTMGARLQELREALKELGDKGEKVLPKYFKGELAQLQEKVRGTLSFATSGIQHETFTHDRSGCIVDSDLQPRPWRDRDLRENPYFRRLCLDVGMRGLMLQIQQLQQRSHPSTSLDQYDTEFDSDLDSDLNSPPPSPRASPRRAKKPAAATGSGRGSKNTTKKFAKKTTTKKAVPTGTSRRSKGFKVVGRKTARKEVVHMTIPAPEKPPSSSAGKLQSSTSAKKRKTPSSVPTPTPEDYDEDFIIPSPTAPQLTSAPRLAPPLPASAAPGPSPKALVSSAGTPRGTRAVPTSIAQVSPLSPMAPYNKLIAKGDSIQMRVVELQSQIRTALSKSAPQSEVTSHIEAAVQTSTVMSRPVCSPSQFNPLQLPSVPTNLDALGGNSAAQLTVSQRVHQALGRVGVNEVPKTVSSKATQSTPPSCSGVAVSNNARPVAVAAAAATTTSNNARPVAVAAASTATSNIAQHYRDVQQLQRVGRNGGFANIANWPPKSSIVVEGEILRRTIDVLLQGLHRVQLKSADRLVLQQMIESAYHFAASPTSLDHNKARQLIGRFSQQLKMATRTLGTLGFQGPPPTTVNVIARPLLQLIPPITRIPPVIPLPPISTAQHRATTPQTLASPSARSSIFTTSLSGSLPHGVIPLPLAQPTSFLHSTAATMQACQVMTSSLAQSTVATTRIDSTPLSQTLSLPFTQVTSSLRSNTVTLQAYQVPSGIIFSLAQPSVATSREDSTPLLQTFTLPFTQATSSLSSIAATMQTCQAMTSSHPQSTVATSREDSTPLLQTSKEFSLPLILKSPKFVIPKPPEIVGEMKVAVCDGGSPPDSATTGPLETTQSIIKEPTTATTAEPQSTTAKPQSTTAKPQTTTAGSQSTTAGPQSTTAEPQSTTAKPQTTTAGSQSTTAGSQSTTAGPQSTTAKPQSTTAKPQTTTAGSQSTTAGPQSTTAEPQSTTAKPQTTTAGSQSTTAGSQSTTAGPQSTTAEPQSTTAKPQTTTVGSQSTTAGPQTTTAGPQPTTAEPQSTTAKPQTTTAGPQTTTAGPKSIVADPMIYPVAIPAAANKSANPNPFLPSPISSADPASPSVASSERGVSCSGLESTCTTTTAAASAGGIAEKSTSGVKPSTFRTTITIRGVDVRVSTRVDSPAVTPKPGKKPASKLESTETKGTTNSAGAAASTSRKSATISLKPPQSTVFASTIVSTQSEEVPENRRQMLKDTSQSRQRATRGSESPILTMQGIVRPVRITKLCNVENFTSSPAPPPANSSAALYTSYPSSSQAGGLADCIPSSSAAVSSTTASESATSSTAGPSHANISLTTTMSSSPTARTTSSNTTGTPHPTTTTVPTTLPTKSTAAVLSGAGSTSLTTSARTSSTVTSQSPSTTTSRAPSSSGVSVPLAAQTSSLAGTATSTATISGIVSLKVNPQTSQPAPLMSQSRTAAFSLLRQVASAANNSENSTTSPRTIIYPQDLPLPTSTNLSVHPPPLSHIPGLSNFSTLHHTSQMVQQCRPPVAKVQAMKVPHGLLIKWTFSTEFLHWQNMVEKYDLYAFVCNRGVEVPDVSLWGKVGEIKPLALPMAVTLTNFARGQCYAFSVRVNYISGVVSRYSDPCTVDL